jgi:glycosidase
MRCLASRRGLRIPEVNATIHGSVGDFVEFLNGANKLGIKVIIDLVANHTSDQRQWFQKDKKSKYRDWYLKKNYWGEE